MDLTEIDKAVTAGGGYAAIKVKTLRDAVGAARAKVNVVADISAGLQAAGYGHIPVDIPRQQDRWVLVYGQRDGKGAGTGAAILAMAIRALGGTEEADSAVTALAELMPMVDAKVS